MYPSSADILIVCPGLAPYLRKTDNSIWSVRNTPIIGLTAVSGLAGRWMSGVTMLIMSSCFFLRKPTVSLLYYLLCRTYKELLYRKKKTHADPGAVLHIYSFEHGMFWKTCPFQSSYL